MTNIWSFLLQTLMASVVAVILLAVKKLLEDKLSPRWQYGVWSVLVLRILVPMDLSMRNLLSMPLLVEVLKSKAEASLSSVFSDIYEPVAAFGVLPFIKVRPNSLTDWLFVLYTTGVIFFLLKYLWTYLRLKNILRKSPTASENIMRKVDDVCEIHNLKPCRVVEVPGISSAFICGVFKPILAVPEGVCVDEKILLHELLHLKYFDTLQNIGWSILRALHWCNPFLQYVFCHIGNDIESLCDQRVLERLEGEERRAYGVILLNMANEKYARAAGTSSISNGGKNISRRIAAIVRFKKYPKGMALVSVCIVFVLASFTVFGRTGGYDSEIFTPKKRSQLDTAMAMTRINRCTTVAGAIDTYAKALAYDNGIFLAAVSPLAQQEALYEAMLQSSEEGWQVCHLQTGDELEYLDKEEGYHILNLKKTGEKQYEIILSFNINSNEVRKYGSVQIPLQIAFSEKDGWIAKEIGERKFIPKDTLTALNEIESLRTLRAVGSTGTFESNIRSMHYVNSENEQFIGSFWNGSHLSETPNLDAEFRGVMIDYGTRYSLEGKTVEGEPQNHVGTMKKFIDSAEETVEFPDEMVAGDLSGSRSDGFSWSSSYIADGWDGVHSDGDIDECEMEKDFTVKLPGFCKVQIFWEGEVVEELLAEEVLQ